MNILQLSTAMAVFALSELTIIVRPSDYAVGVGMADVTGPPVKTIFMGYANLKQVGEGIHTRQWARCFAFTQNGTTFVYVSVDANSMTYGVKNKVIKKLQAIYGSLYTSENVLLSVTHTHSTPGGANEYLILDISCLGFVNQTSEAYTAGIVKCITRAHEAIVPARLYVAKTEVNGVNINRSPTSYLENPASERERYVYDVDKTLVQLQIVRQSNDSLMGALNWFAVHPNSMNNTNSLVSADNVGYASILMEKALNPNGTLPGQGTVVTAFASTNLGDVSPNTRGPLCQKTGSACDAYTSQCPDGDVCIASGPGKDMFHSTKIIATTLGNAATNLSQTRGEEITGVMSLLHQYIDMPTQVVPVYDPVTQNFNQSKLGSGCVAALGYSFAAGTTDGPGAFSFSQGTNGSSSGNIVWDTARNLLARPHQEDIECHSPKTILLATGRNDFPYAWSPRVVSVQMITWGSQFVVASVPGELTTMAGRRARQVIANVIANITTEQAHVVMAGLSNIYTHYVTTFEEYQAQRYEAASTLYGPHTLDILLYAYKNMATAITQGNTVDAGPNPESLDENKLISTVLPVLVDVAPLLRKFGDCTEQPNKQYNRGDVVNATFVSGDPRNNLQHDSWYLAVERLQDSFLGWDVVLTDGDWDTILKWKSNTVEVQWTISEDTSPGTYRLLHKGHNKLLLAEPTAYEGYSDSFTIV